MSKETENRSKTLIFILLSKETEQKHEQGRIAAYKISYD